MNKQLNKGTASAHIPYIDAVSLRLCMDRPPENDQELKEAIAQLEHIYRNFVVEPLCSSLEEKPNS